MTAGVGQAEHLLGFSLQKLLSTGAITFAFKVRAHEQYESVIA
jgi:hypothetical protein